MSSAGRFSSETNGAAASPVATLLAGLNHPHRDGIAQLRTLILDLDSRITEEVKWNAPSHQLDDHFATFRLHPPKAIQLILHTGAKARSNARKFTIDDPAGLLQWPATDRCVLTLKSASELKAHLADVRSILRQWIDQL